MPDTPTPGAIAYAAYVAAYPDVDWDPCTWRELVRTEQQRWEAAAQAVRADLLADMAWAQQAPSSRWLVVPPPEEPAR